MKMTDVFYEMTGNRRCHTIISLCALSQPVLGSESAPIRGNTHYYHQEQPNNNITGGICIVVY